MPLVVIKQSFINSLMWCDFAPKVPKVTHFWFERDFSLSTVMVGVVRYWSKGAYSEKQAFSETIMPMGIGSVIGAVVGGLLVGILPASVSKIVLGIILYISAWRIFRHHATN